MQDRKDATLKNEMPLQSAKALRLEMQAMQGWAELLA